MRLKSFRVVLLYVLFADAGVLIPGLSALLTLGLVGGEDHDLARGNCGQQHVEGQRAEGAELGELEELAGQQQHVGGHGVDGQDAVVAVHGTVVDVHLSLKIRNN